MDPVGAVSALGGCARRAQLLRLGLTDPQLLDAVHSGSLARPHRGCYALPDASFASVRARVMSAQLTCVSAAVVLDLPALVPSGGLHVAVPWDRGIVQGDRRLKVPTTVHRLPRALRHGDDALCVDALTLIDHMSACTGLAAQLAVVDAALNRSLIRLQDVWTMTGTAPRRRAWLVAHADPLSQSPGETLARLELRQAGFAVVSQARIAGVGHVDLLVDDLVVVEVDGENYHSSPEAQAEDARRDAVLAAAGIPRIRIPFTAVRDEPGRVTTEVRAKLAAYGRSRSA
ncbi:type IV toxin-antitoxin system AbiEi family antitoxin domain-containing protein [Demequina sp. SYSU T00192]|uniref:Type IV toxin-antitoxin system AbiEi family antitoxin domain-containing protein n=1 Tax=Demequina litoralis TaxID=3051660 RepID=A0ABT8G7H0_9MICO|nr:type IV toxin-antitoxin system AbiEi family antitoxin domain-containing protein [Demequina sp. SYSU T00192]MDN4475096.1 type IV toxin-antitoxin system AbiEi family antitoxin domain-containing protein [Demequina sp. SYSU T00192]